jgi:hypothetical protein
VAALVPTMRGAGSRSARVLAQWRGSVAGRVAALNFICNVLLSKHVTYTSTQDLATRRNLLRRRFLPRTALPSFFFASLAVSEDLGLHSALEILGKAREKRHPGIYESAVKGGAWSVGITSEMPKTFQFACHTFESLRRVSNI